MSTNQISSRRLPVVSRSGWSGDPLMSLEFVTRGPVTVIAVRGEVDMSNAHLLTELAEHVVGDRPLRLVLDLAEVTFFCADGVKGLLRIQRAVTAEAGHLVLRDPSPITLRVLTLTGVLHRFTIHASTATA